jgi:hypothetical protein
MVGVEAALEIRILHRHGKSIREIARETGVAHNVAGGNAPIFCQDYGVPPPLTTHNGLAQFQLLNTTFQGYVTPQATSRCLRAKAEWLRDK